MKINRSVTMKHSMHRTRDLDIDFEADPIERTLRIDVDWIDTLLLMRFLDFTVLHMVSDALKAVGKEPGLTSVIGYEIELVVGGKVNLDLQLIERDFSPKDPTLVMRLKE